MSIVETPITSALFSDCPDIAEVASSVCNSMQISSVSILESALEDSELVKELLSRCVSATNDTGIISSCSGVTALGDVVESEPAPGTKVAKKGKSSTPAPSAGSVKSSSGVVSLEVRVLQARFRAAFRNVVRRAKDTKDFNKNLDAFTDKATTRFGRVPIGLVMPTINVTDKLRKDPLEYVELKVVTYNESSSPKLSQAMTGEQVWCVPEPKGVPPRTLPQWLSVIIPWGLGVLVNTGAGTLALLEYLARVTNLASRSSVSDALVYDYEYRRTMRNSVHRIRTDNPNLSVAKAVEIFLSVNQSPELYAQALANAPRHTHVLPTGKGGKGSSVLSNGVRVSNNVSGVCRYTRASCPYKPCRFSVHVGDPVNLSAFSGSSLTRRYGAQHTSNAGGSSSATSLNNGNKRSLPGSQNGADNNKFSRK